jgi:hypothetical protein
MVEVGVTEGVLVTEGVMEMVRVLVTVGVKEGDLVEVGVIEIEGV